MQLSQPGWLALRALLLCIRRPSPYKNEGPCIVSVRKLKLNLRKIVAFFGKESRKLPSSPSSCLSSPHPCSSINPPSSSRESSICSSSKRQHRQPSTAASLPLLDVQPSSSTSTRRLLGKDGRTTLLRTGLRRLNHRLGDIPKALPLRLRGLRVLPRLRLPRRRNKQSCCNFLHTAENCSRLFLLLASSQPATASPLLRLREPRLRPDLLPLPCKLPLPGSRRQPASATRGRQKSRALLKPRAPLPCFIRGPHCHLIPATLTLRHCHVAATSTKHATSPTATSAPLPRHPPEEHLNNFKRPLDGAFRPNL